MMYHEEGFVRKLAVPPKLGIGAPAVVSPRQAAVVQKKYSPRKQPHHFEEVNNNNNKKKISDFLQDAQKRKAKTQTEVSWNATKLQRDRSNNVPQLHEGIERTPNPPKSQPLGLLAETWVDNVLERRKLKQAGLDRDSLTKLGLERDSIDRIYRAMHVYSIGFHDCIAEIVSKKPAVKPNLMGQIWRVYSQLLEISDAEICTDGMACVERSHQEEIDELREQHDEAVKLLLQEQRDFEKKYEKLQEEKLAVETQVRDRDDKILALKEELQQQKKETERQIFQKQRTEEEKEKIAQKMKKLETQMRFDGQEHHKSAELVYQLRQKLQEKEKELQAMKTDYKVQLRLTNDLSSQNEAINAKMQGEIIMKEEALTNLAKTTQDLEYCEKNLEITQRELRSLTDRFAVQAKDLGQMKSEYNHITRECDELRQKLQIASDEIRNYEREAHMKREELQQVKASLKKYIDSHSVTSSENQTLKGQLSAVERKLKKSEMQRDRLKEELKHSSDTIKSMDDKMDSLLDKYQQLLSQRNDLKQELETKTEEYDVMSESLKKTKLALSERSDALSKSKTMVSTLENKIQTERASYQEREANSRKDLKDLRLELQNLHNDLNKERSEKDKMLERALLAEDQISIAQGRVVAVSQQLKELARLQAEVEDYQAAATHADQRIHKAEEIIDSFVNDALLINEILAERPSSSDASSRVDSVSRPGTSGSSRPGTGHNSLRPSTASSQSSVKSTQSALVRLQNNRNVLKDVEHGVRKLKDLLTMEISTRKAMEHKYDQQIEELNTEILELQLKIQDLSS